MWKLYHACQTFYSPHACINRCHCWCISKVNTQQHTFSGTCNLSSLTLRLFRPVISLTHPTSTVVLDRAPVMVTHVTPTAFYPFSLPCITHGNFSSSVLIHCIYRVRMPSGRKQVERDRFFRHQLFKSSAGFSNSACFYNDSTPAL